MVSNSWALAELERKRAKNPPIKPPEQRPAHDVRGLNEALNRLERRKK